MTLAPMPLEPDIEKKINRWVYCHHCHQMSWMILLGRVAGDRMAFLCTAPGLCHARIEFDVALRRDH